MCNARALLCWTLTIIEPTVDYGFREFRNFSLRAIKSSVSTLGDKRIKEITSLERKAILGFLIERDTFACLLTGYGRSLIFHLAVRVAAELSVFFYYNLMAYLQMEERGKKIAIRIICKRVAWPHIKTNHLINIIKNYNKLTKSCNNIYNFVTNLITLALNLSTLHAERTSRGKLFHSSTIL